MNETGILPYVVVYEPSSGPDRQHILGPFRSFEAAISFIGGDNIAVEYECAWALPLRPPAAEPQVLAVR